MLQEENLTTGKQEDTSSKVINLLNKRGGYLSPRFAYIPLC